MFISSEKNHDSTTSVPADRIRLTEVITQANSNGQQLTKINTSGFNRMCRLVCGCLTPKITPRTSRTAALPPQSTAFTGRNTLVLDLDETLVHSSYALTPDYDFTVPVVIDDEVNYVYVAKRPGVDDFLLKAVQYFEVVIFTASLRVYADPLIARLAKDLPLLKLFRQSCRYINGSYIKDLSRLGRNLPNVVIIDVSVTQNSPSSFALQPQNAIEIKSWFSDPGDHELDYVWKILERLIDASDIPGALSQLKKDLSATIDTTSPFRKVEKGLSERPGFNSPVGHDNVSFVSVTF